MKKYVTSTNLIIAGAIVMFSGIALGFPKIAAIMGGLPWMVGSVMQICEACISNNNWLNQIAERQRKHDALMRRASELPPKEAIELLLSTH